MLVFLFKSLLDYDYRIYIDGDQPGDDLSDGWTVGVSEQSVEQMVSDDHEAKKPN